MKSKIVIALIGATCVAVLLIAVAITRNTLRQEESSKTPQLSSQNTIPQGGAKEGQIPSLTFTDYKGEHVSLFDFSGLPLVVNAWATWCPFCTKELADFAAVQEQYRGKVVFIAIDRVEPRDVAKSFTDKVGVTKKMIFLLDPQDDFYKAIGGFSMPETLFVDSSGRIEYHKRGPMDINEIQERTKALLE